MLIVSELFEDADAGFLTQMYNALTGIGGSGQVDGTVAANANVALLSAMAGTALFVVGPIFDRIGPRACLLIGGWTYPLYSGSLLCFNRRCCTIYILLSKLMLVSRYGERCLCYRSWSHPRYRCIIPLGGPRCDHDDVRPRIAERPRHCSLLDYLQSGRRHWFLGQFRYELPLNEWNRFGRHVHRFAHYHGHRMAHGGSDLPAEISASVNSANHPRDRKELAPRREAHRENGL